MNITYSKRAAKAISKINNPFKQSIKLAIERLPSGDVKKLQGYKNAYRLRARDYRIFFDMDAEIEITDVLPRGGAYRK
ncbi:MAG: type II toxin-antitoxin system RelE/ParE family toxin [Defluviitaleaceae bacterium]|nr:type II toxin-antitoxin system RelE/ParE family toxin [Defluviitaleaceae bacterium]